MIKGKIKGKIKVLVVLLVATFLLVCCSPSGSNNDNLDQDTQENSTEFYVATTGNDSNDGSFENPWKTFNKAVSEVNAGDTVYVMEGVYRERLVINKSGTLDNWIVFKAYQEDNVTIDGEGLTLTNWQGLIDIPYQDYVRVSGFRVVNSPAMGIMAYENDHVEIVDNYVFNIFSPGIHVWNSSNILIDGNVVDRAMTQGPNPLESVSLRNLNGFTVSNNTVSNSEAIGIDAAEGCINGSIMGNEVYNTGLGIYLDAWDKHLNNVVVYDNDSHHNNVGIAVNAENGGVTENVKVYNNLTHNNTRSGFVIGWGGVEDTSHTVINSQFYGNKSYDNGNVGFVILGVNNGEVVNIDIYNNLFYGNKGGGIAITDVAGDNVVYDIKNIDVYNNTIVDNGEEGRWAAGGLFLSKAEMALGKFANIRIHNNIISGNKNFSTAIWKFGGIIDNVVIKNNLLDGFLSDIANYGEIRDPSDILGNPSFVDAVNFDFHLNSDSDAVDKGITDNVPSVDFDNIIRPQGDGVDIGAFEYVD